MIIIHGFYSPYDFALLPAINISAYPCDSCEKLHGWQVMIGWLWWGVILAWGLDGEEGQ